MSSDKNRLIELIIKCDKDNEVLECFQKRPKKRQSAEIIADHLLANGVIVPPVEIGTKVYVITSQTSNGKNLYIFEDIITHYVICDNYTLMCFENHIAEANHNWDKVFLTKEQAEQALAERSGGNAEM